MLRLTAKPRSTELAAEAARLVAASTSARGGRPAVLAAVIATEQEDAHIYIARLLKQAAAAGLAVREVSLPPDSDEASIKRELESLSADPDIAGIILNYPLPPGVDRERAAASIARTKDVDGLSPENAELLESGRAGEAILPATAAAVMELLAAHGIAVAGRRAAVVGRSAVAGRPIATLLRQAGASVGVVHSKTADMGAITRPAEIVVVAAGVRGLLRGEHVSPGAVVVDVGIHADGDSVAGDVDAASVEPVLGERGALSPVPGGVGPLTNAVLVLQAAHAAVRLADAGRTART
ncbi:MAG: hypothetical protein RLZZ432_974 [Chloroflexota bacterium]